jgi:hypothetical protein
MHVPHCFIVVRHVSAFLGESSARGLKTGVVLWQMEVAGVVVAGVVVVVAGDK